MKSLPTTGDTTTMMNDDVPPESRKRKRQRGWGERRDDFLDGTPFNFDPNTPAKKTKVISAADFNAENPPATYSRDHAGPVGAARKPVAAFSTDKTEREPYRPQPRSRSGGRFGRGRGRSSSDYGDDSLASPDRDSRATSSGRYSSFQRSRANTDDGESRDGVGVAIDSNGAAAGAADALLEGRRPKRKARDKVMDILARRPHSRLEIEQKMSPYYSQKEIDDAIQFADENGWMMAPEEMAERLSAELGRRRKGHKYIAQYLKKRGLPQVETDRDDEVEKALALIASKAEQFGRASVKSTERTLAKASRKAERAAGKAASAQAETDGNLIGRSYGARKPFAQTKSGSSDFDAKRIAFMERGKVVQKIQAALASRGFDGDTISRAIRIWQDEQKDS